MLILSSNGTRSRKAAVLIWRVFNDSGIGSGVGSVGAAGAGAASGAGGIGMSAGAGIFNSGMLAASNGAIGSGAGVTISSLGSGKGPTGSPNSPVSPSGTEEGAATGSEKTGSILVLLVMSSIAFWRSLSTVGCVVVA